MQPADVVVRGGRVHTMDAARHVVSALAVRRGRIVALGYADAVAPLIGPRTEVVELGGHTVLPGFQDAHAHPLAGGLTALQCDLYAQTATPGYQAVLRLYAERHPDRPWVVGGGWSMDHFPGGTPSRALLDEVVPDRPVYLVNRDGHGAWVNTRALELAGVDASTADPPDGRIEREPGGAPQGTLHEGAMGLVERLLPPIAEADWDEAFRRCQAQLHAYGITAARDARVEAAERAAYLRAAERGLVTLRVVGDHLYVPERGLDQVDALVELTRSSTLGRVRLDGVKIFQDGVMENATAGLLEPYLDAGGAPREERGLSLVEPQELCRAVTALDARGLQVHVHAIGDRAVREALDAIAAARAANGPRDARHHLAHLQLVHPADLPRFGALGVVANAQPLWACPDGAIEELTAPFIGPERAGRLYPFGSLVRAGAPLAFGSDWPVTTADPLPQLEVAVDRRDPDDRQHGCLLPEERLDLPAALAAFTIGSAHVNRLEHETGSLEVGKLADLVVLDRDVFAPDAGPVGRASVLLTLSEGQRVHAAGDLA